MSIAYPQRQPRHPAELATHQLPAAGFYLSFAWIAAALLLGSAWEGYSFAAHAISGLAAAPGGWLMNLAFVVSGAGAAVFGHWFAGRLPGFPGQDRARRLLAGFGAFFATLGVFSISGGAGSLGNTLHLVAFAGAMLCLLRALDLIGGGLAGTGSWNDYARFTTGVRGAVPVLLIVMLALLLPMSPLAALGLGGAAEWVLFLTVWAWLAVSARRAGLFGGSASGS